MLCEADFCQQWLRNEVCHLASALSTFMGWNDVRWDAHEGQASGHRQRRAPRYG